MKIYASLCHPNLIVLTSHRWYLVYLESMFQSYLSRCEGPVPWVVLHCLPRGVDWNWRQLHSPLERHSGSTGSHGLLPQGTGPPRPSICHITEIWVWKMITQLVELSANTWGDTSSTLNVH